jgi:RND family efflux transporter MFP subunit
MAEGQREMLDRLRINRDEDDEENGGGKRWLIVALVTACVLLAALAIYSVWPKGEEQTAATETPAASDTSAPASATSGTTTVGSGGVLSASGYVTARRLATVSAEITGRIADVFIEEGMTVQAGQVLARLDDTLAKTDLGAAEGNQKSARGALAAAQADEAEAKRVLERVRGMRAKDFSSVADSTKAEAAAKSATARLTQAEGNLKAAENALARARAVLDKHEVRAPFGGVVTTKDAQPGEIVSPAAAGGGFTRTGICTIVDMNSLEVEVEVNEAFISRVKPGQKASATLDAYPDWDIPANVAAIIPTANRDKATVKVRVALEARDPRVLPEMAAKVLFYDDKAAEVAPVPAPTTDPKGTP